MAEDKRLDQGFISLLLLMLVTFLGGAAYLSFYKANSLEKMVGYEAHRIKAVYLADSGLQWAFCSLRQDPDWQGGTKNIEGSGITVGVERNTDGYKITSRAEVGSSRQIRYAEVAFSDNREVTIRAYGELYY